MNSTIFELYGPLQFLIGTWESEGLKGENRAPDPDRKIENTKFRQVMEFVPIAETTNHEQSLYGLRYHTKAWEEGADAPDDAPFHEEVGYFIWDAKLGHVMKSFIVPRGIAVQAGGACEPEQTEFKVTATLGSTIYGVCSNPFLDEEFQTVDYTVTFKKIDDDTIAYDENTRIKIKGQEKLFDHTEKNTLRRVK